MNERIKNLALEAELIYPVPPSTEEPLPHHVKAIEKFAALVIAECKKEIQKKWYEANNKKSEEMDDRGVAIHVGYKTGLIAAINALE